MLLKSGAGLRRVILTVVLLFGTVSRPGFLLQVWADRILQTR